MKNNKVFDEGDLVFYFKYLDLRLGEVSQAYPKAVFVGGEIIPNEHVYHTRIEAINVIVRVAEELSLKSCNELIVMLKDRL